MKNLIVWKGVWIAFLLIPHLTNSQTTLTDTSKTNLDSIQTFNNQVEDTSYCFTPAQIKAMLEVTGKYEVCKSQNEQLFHSTSLLNLQNQSQQQEIQGLYLKIKKSKRTTRIVIAVSVVGVIMPYLLK